MKDHKGVLVPLALVLVIVLGIGAFFGEGGDYLSSGGIESEEKEQEEIEESKDTYSSAPSMQIDEDDDYIAVIETNFGTIEVDLLEKNAPKTVNNFVFLAEDGFYNNLTFHRVVEGFVIQGGDPKGDGTGNPGYAFGDEINPDSIGLDTILVKQADFLAGLYSTWNAATMAYAPNNLREHANDTLADFYENEVGYDYDYSINSVRFAPGVLAMANSGPNTNGSQFFITVGNSEPSQLNGRHTVFGKVLDGMDVVDEIAEVPVDRNQKPIDTVRIESITIEKR